MSSPPGDRDDARLREAMGALRRHDERHAPTFEAVRARRPPPRLFRAVAPIAGAVAVAAGVLAVWCSGAYDTQTTASKAAAPAAAPAGLAEPAGGGGGTGGLPSLAAAPPPDDVVSPPGVELAPLDFLLDAPSRAFVAGGPSSLDFLISEAP